MQACPSSLLLLFIPYHPSSIVYNKYAKVSQLPELARDWGPHTIASKKRCSLGMLSANLQLKTLLPEEEIIQEAKGCILECLGILERQLQFKSASSGARIP